MLAKVLGSAVAVLALVTACSGSPAASPARHDLPAQQPTTAPAEAGTPVDTGAGLGLAAPEGAPALTEPAAASGLANLSLTGFRCADSRSDATADTTVTAVRVAQHAGFDRFVIEFGGAVGGYDVQRQPAPTFVLDPSGQKATLAGSAGLLVRLHRASAMAYSGPTELRLGGSAIREARQIGNFEAVTSWGLGLSRPGCLRVSTLANPSRLVVDVQH